MKAAKKLMAKEVRTEVEDVILKKAQDTVSNEEIAGFIDEKRSVNQQSN